MELHNRLTGGLSAIHSYVESVRRVLLFNPRFGEKDGGGQFESFGVRQSEEVGLQRFGNHEQVPGRHRETVFDHEEVFRLAEGALLPQVREDAIRHAKARYGMVPCPEGSMSRCGPAHSERDSEPDS